MDEYAGKSNADIIAEQAASLQSKGNYQTSDKFQPRNTTLSDESGVNESGISSFPGASVHVGRTGQTGGGTKAQIIPPEEGGDDRSQRPGTTSDAFEGEGQFGGAEEKRFEALRQNPGGYDVNPRGIEQHHDARTHELAPRTEEQALEPDQVGTTQSYGA